MRRMEGSDSVFTGFEDSILVDERRSGMKACWCMRRVFCEGCLEISKPNQYLIGPRSEIVKEEEMTVLRD